MLPNVCGGWAGEWLGDRLPLTSFSIAPFALGSTQASRSFPPAGHGVSESGRFRNGGLETEMVISCPLAHD